MAKAAMAWAESLHGLGIVLTGVKKTAIISLKIQSAIIQPDESKGLFMSVNSQDNAIQSGNQTVKVLDIISYSIIRLPDVNSIWFLEIETSDASIHYMLTKSKAEEIGQALLQSSKMMVDRSEMS
ncbi:hypothetical protein IPV08_16085 [Methylobacterium sp. SD274]|uniref:hypothetical protein n=1 Tax=Methylobacterium sp. SD274 TaxID=2782009 RepID=UPI001A95A145|nr:hypothetical protein [Methylobacterium sp. SD274]MBO1021481.1 hypothetical protein [Methylobacterium sp. SD274]